MQVREKNKNGIIGSRGWQRMLAYLLAGALIGVELPGQIQAQESRKPEAQSTEESTESEFVAAKPQIVSPTAVDLGILRLESARGADAAPSVRQSLSLLNTSGFLGALSRPRFSADAVRDFRLPVGPQPQTSSGKKSKAGGLIIGLIGLGLAGGGAYLAATSKPIEHFVPALTTCTGVFPNQRCMTSPRKRIGTGINAGRYAGFGLITLGIGVAVAGFGKM